MPEAAPGEGGTAALGDSCAAAGAANRALSAIAKVEVVIVSRAFRIVNPKQTISEAVPLPADK